MKSQRKAREVALQVLFQQGFHENANAKELFESFSQNFDFDEETRNYALFLTDGILNNQETLDGKISELSENWRVDRIAVIDRILLHIALFELTVSDSTPTAPKLAITDIIDLAKKYSSEDSKNFINGLLDQVYNQQVDDQNG